MRIKITEFDHGTFTAEAIHPTQGVVIYGEGQDPQSAIAAMMAMKEAITAEVRRRDQYRKTYRFVQAWQMEMDL